MLHCCIEIIVLATNCPQCQMLQLIFVCMKSPYMRANGYRGKMSQFHLRTLAEGPVFDWPFDAFSNEFVCETSKKKNRNNLTQHIQFGHHRFCNLSEFRENAFESRPNGPFANQKKIATIVTFSSITVKGINVVSS